MADQGLPVWDINLVLDEARLSIVLQTSGGSRGINAAITDGLKGLLLRYVPSKTELSQPGVFSPIPIHAGTGCIEYGDTPKIQVGKLEVIGGNFKETYCNGGGLPWEFPLSAMVPNSEELLPYNGTSEFELAFFPYDVVMGLLDYSDDTIGLRITRGFITYPHLVRSYTLDPPSFYEMQSYRTLTARPEKDPVAPKDQFLPSNNIVSHDEALSVYYAPPCPPIWEENGLVMKAFGLSPFATMRSVSTETHQIFPPTQLGFFKLLRLSIASVVKPAWRRFLALNPVIQRIRRLFSSSR